MKDDEKRFLKLMQARCNLEGMRREFPRAIIAAKNSPVSRKRAAYILEKWLGKGWYNYGVSLDTGWMTREGMAVRFEGGRLVTTMLEPTRENFDRVADTWQRFIQHVSTWEMMKTREGYALLVSMGEAVVPFVLARLKAERSIDWCFLLMDLTGEAPAYRPREVDGVMRFDVDKFARAWLKWGKAKQLMGG